MINENYDVINDLAVRAKYSVLFYEVCEHDEEYQQWCKNDFWDTIVIICIIQMNHT